MNRAARVAMVETTASDLCGGLTNPLTSVSPLASLQAPLA